MSKPDLSDPITIRLPKDVLAEIERIAAGIDRSRSWVMVRALRHYLATEGEEILAILQARSDTETGGAHDADDVMRELTALVSDIKAA